MVEFYILQIQMGKMELSDVPTHWYDAVKEALDNE